MAQNLKINILAKDRTKQAMTSVRGGLAKVKSAVFSLQTAFIGLGAGLVIKNLVSTGKELENLRVRLKFLLKDTNEGAKAFDNMVKFASKVPFSLQEIQAGSGILATVTDNADDLQNMLEITGNVAAVTGLDFRTASEQIQRSFSAGIGAADLFREKGVRNMLGFKAGATVSIEETVAAFEKVFGRDGRFGNSTDELAKTFEGTLSMIGDKIFNFKKVLLEAGLFEELKKQFGDLDKFLESNGEKIDIIAEKIGRGLGIAFKGLVDTLKFLKDNIDSIVFALSGLIALKVALFFKGVTTAIAGMTIAMNGFNMATKRNIIFGSITVFASAMGFLIHKFKEFKGELNAELPTFKELNEDIAKLEVRLKQNSKASKSAIREQIALKKSQLAQLETESGLLHLQNTTHMRNMNLQLGILNSKEEITKETQKAFHIFESHHKLVKAVENAEKQRAERLIGSNRNIFEETRELINLQEKAEQERIEKLIKGNRNVFEEQLKVAELFKKDKGAFDGFKEGLESEFDVTIFDRFREAGQSSLQSLKSSITDFVMTGKLSFKALKEAIIRSLVEALVGQAVTSALRKATEIFKLQAVREGLISVYKAALKAFASIPFPLNILAAGATIGAGMKLVDKIKGFESGGAVRKGQPTIVGERGAEMFIPNSSGQITQSARGTNGGGVNVNFNINTVDASGFEELLVRSRGTITQLINNAVNEKGRSSII